MRQAFAQSMMGVLMLVLVSILSSQAGKIVMTQEVMAESVKKAKAVIVLDPGHGGDDPGKVGVDGKLEKDINLQIVLKLKHYLEQADIQVILTRDSDAGLYKASDTQKKLADMKERCRIMNETNPDLVVSIHQNSYHQEGISGAQVFYYKKSEKGKRLAELIQKRFDYVLGEENNRRGVKANDSYYLLLHTKPPIALVECGFLSNWAESAKLGNEEYQDRIAWAVHMGILEYLNREKIQIFQPGSGTEKMEATEQ